MTLTRSICKYNEGHQTGLYTRPREWRYQRRGKCLLWRVRITLREGEDGIKTGSDSSDRLLDTKIYQTEKRDLTVEVLLKTDKPSDKSRTLVDRPRVRHKQPT